MNFIVKIENKNVVKNVPPNEKNVPQNKKNVPPNEKNVPPKLYI